MLCLLSPAKKLDTTAQDYPVPCSEPEFLQYTQQLIKILKPLSSTQLSSLMGISKQLGELNYERFQRWRKQPSADAAKAAGFLFKGDVYQGLQINDLSTNQLKFAQKHVRILSGLYGLLKPMDAIQAYRLEMGTQLANKKGHSLYDFWTPTLTAHINDELAKQKNPFLVNLASNEYFKAVDSKQLDWPIISPVFKDEKNGQFKIISFYAKKARGLMAKFIIENKITKPEQLQDFDTAGYQFVPHLSENPHTLIFHRQEK